MPAADGDGLHPPGQPAAVNGSPGAPNVALPRSTGCYARSPRRDAGRAARVNIHASAEPTAGTASISASS